MPESKNKTFSVEHLWQIERVSGAALSPDGAQAVCSVASHSMADNKAEASLWLLSTFGGGPRRLTSCGEKDGQAAWSPAGDAIAFVARREQQGKKDETPQLYLIAPDGGEARRASDHAPGIDAFKWFPDGRRVAFVAWVWPELKGAKAQAKRWREFKDRKESAYTTSETLYRFWDHNLPMGRVAHLHVLDPKTGRVRDLFEGTGFELPRAEPDANCFDIAPDGRSIVFAYDPAPVKKLDNRHALAEIDLRSGAITTVALDADWDFGYPRYSHDGRRIAFLASHQARRHTMPTQLALLERGGRRAKPGWRLIAADWDRSVDAPLRCTVQDDAVLFTAEDRGRRHLFQIALDAHTPQPVARGGWVQGFDCAGDMIVTVADAMHHPARVHAQRAGSDEPPLRLERFNDELLAPFRFNPGEEVEVRGANGEPVQMWLTFPPGFAKKTGKRYPLLHSIHGGPHACTGDTFHY
ncbi:MAG TPA: S9 family peptidase, partial [Burkholderiaceae bacterium]|nr:S9 family peptidase [Burkholderiaceae bacterium]